MTTKSARIPSPCGLSERFTLGPRIFSCTDKDGTAVLNVEGDKMYSVIGLGSLILTKLATSDSGLTFASIVDKVTMEAEKIPRPQSERDVARLLGVFQQKGIVQSDTTQPHRCTLPMHDWTISGFIFLTHSVVNLLIKLRVYSLAAFLGLFLINIILKVVDRTTTWYPKQAHCLQRSAVAVCLLRTCGLPAQMVIGVNKVPFKSHAWAEVFSEVVNDSPKVSTRYKVLDRC